jgi:hypothetical protein
MKVYKWYDGKLVENEVIKETAKMYYLKNTCHRAFNWSSKIYKDRAHTTPESALNKAIREGKASMEAWKRRVNDLNSEIHQMEKMLRKIKGE